MEEISLFFGGLLSLFSVFSLVSLTFWLLVEQWAGPIWSDTRSG